MLFKSLAFAAGFALLFLGQVAVSPTSRTVWLVPGLMLVVVMLLGVLPSYRPVESRLPFFFGYGSAFAIAYIYSVEPPIAGSTAERISRLAIPLLVLTLLVGLVFYIRSWPLHPSAKWLGIVFGLGLLLAYFSGEAGGTGHGGWERWLTQHLDLSPGAAYALVVIARKAVHIAFYGLLAFSAWSAARAEKISKPEAVLFAAILSMSHAGFDELRQSVTPDRTGSVWDLLIDLVGVVLFLTLATRPERPLKALRGLDSGDRCDL